MNRMNKRDWMRRDWPGRDDDAPWSRLDDETGRGEIDDAPWSRLDDETGQGEIDDAPWSSGELAERVHARQGHVSSTQAHTA